MIDGQLAADLLDAAGNAVAVQGAQHVERLEHHERKGPLLHVFLCHVGFPQDIGTVAVGKQQKLYAHSFFASLNHPNIATIYGLEDATDGPYLVLELVEGETLAARLLRGALPPSEALELRLQIAAAIEAAHERGVIHRDLKPGNVMLTHAGIAKVVDFGLAKSEPILGTGGEASDLPTATAHAEATVPGLVLGTVAYMSPEQARGKVVDRRCDIWSFGCVLFECLTARPAFAGETTSDLIARILEREPDWAALPPGTPMRVRELLRRCLRKDATVRPRDMRDVRLELAEVVSRGAHSTSSEHSIAVLPFENLGNREEEYFSDGVTDELLNALSHIEGLRVAARSSCFAFKGRRENLRVVGENLEVTTVLEGSVRRAGQRLRITAQLVNARDGYQLWSEQYDREMTDVFVVQEEIAGAIATRLRGTLRDEFNRSHARPGTKNLEAYELLLKGRALQNKRGRFLLEATSCFEDAIALDPNYADAMAWLSDSYRLISFFGSAPFSDAMPKAKRLAQRALAIDPGLSEAWVTIACVEDQYEWDFERAKVSWERALAIDPRHTRARGQRALWALARGAWSADEALAETRRALQDDPLNSWVAAMHSFVLGFAAKHDDSIAEAERALALDADSFFAHWSVMRSRAWAGQYDRAIEMVPALLRDSGRHQWVLGTLAWAYGNAGQTGRARAVYDEMEARSRHEFLAPSWLTVAAASAGLLEQSFAYLVRAVSDRDPLVIWARLSPFWDVARRHPRFEEVTRKVWG